MGIFPQVDSLIAFDQEVNLYADSNVIENSSDEIKALHKKMLDNGFVIVEYIRQDWNGSEWLNYMLEAYTYNNDENLIERLKQLWNIDGSIWEDFSKMTFEYSENNLIDTLSFWDWVFDSEYVDDGSDDNTAEICRRMEREGGIDCFVRNEVRGGKASAANTALRYSKGKYILHLDADSHLADDTIETILLPFIMDERIGAVGGDVRVANCGDNIITSLQSIEYLKSITTGRTIASSLGILRIISGAHGAFRRDVLQRIQGWDVGPGLDGDITLKIRKLGLKVVHEPMAICYTNVPVSMSKLAKQRYRWDRSLIRFRVRKHHDVLQRSKSFNVANFFASSENIFFNLILNFKWWIYLLQMVIFNLEWVGYIFFINYVLYTSANFLQFLVATVLVGEGFERRHFMLYLFLPLMPFYYGVYLRIVRTYAYIMEFFHKVSYWDSWNPWKVSKVAKREKL